MENTVMARSTLVTATTRAAPMMVLIPAYEPTLELVELVATLRRRGARVLVVDDGSSVETQSVLGQLEPYCVVLHRQHEGKGAALKAGLTWMLGHCPTDAVVVTADADGQHSVDDIMVVGQRALAEPDALWLGTRRFGATTPWRSRVGNAVTGLVFRLVSGVSLSDTQTGLRAFPLAMAPDLIQVPGQRYEYETNVLLDCSRHGRPIREHGIETRYFNNNAGSHFSPWRDSWLILRDIAAFAASSLIAFVLDYGLFALLTVVGSVLGWGHTVIWANVVARVVSASTNYAVNKRRVFRVSGRVVRTFLGYAALASSILVVNTLALTGLVDHAGWNPYLAKVVVELACFVISWLAQRHLIFAPGWGRRGEGSSSIWSRGQSGDMAGRVTTGVMTAAARAVVTAVGR
ncbi:MAG: bifunctional glycosyltransferase family 2/GtrA family protein [Propionibacteriaceae bacterium]|jgi:putative flippase GtrA|nr:bifunctional glycosyltransferase family 2/GtrA family protein [Propionibacteriaceae bacterium]